MRTHGAGLAPNPFFSSREQRLSLARERFFDEGESPTGLVPDVVLQSWHRCLRARRAPQEHLVIEPVTKTRIATVLARHRLLLDVARADLAELDAAVSKTSARVLLLSRDGIVAHATSPAGASAATLLGAISRVGVDLGEHHVGTGAPNVASRLESGCVVLGGEHFFNEMKSLYCAAAPIRDASGRVAAVLNISSERAMFRFDAGSMVRLYASTIENRLLVAQSGHRMLLRFHTSPLFLHTPLAGLACVSEEGCLRWLNEAGASLLGIARVPAALTMAESVFGLRVEAALAGSHGAAPARVVVPGGLALWIEAAPASGGRIGSGSEPQPEPPTAPDLPPATTEAADGGAPPPADIKLHDASRAMIESRLAARGGNVSRAARDLGVSRGLLYRRIRAWGLLK